jgi:hypothetical protein
VPTLVWTRCPVSGTTWQEQAPAPVHPQPIDLVICPVPSSHPSATRYGACTLRHRTVSSDGILPLQHSLDQAIPPSEDSSCCLFIWEGASRTRSRAPGCVQVPQAQQPGPAWDPAPSGQAS